MNALKDEINVLIIDDCPEDRFVYKKFLHKNGEINFTIQECETGEGALELCKTYKPDCLLLDYDLPDMDGLEILSELSPLTFAVVMLTGEGTEQLVVQALKNGVQDYLVKEDLTRNILANSIYSAVKMFKIEAEKQRFSAGLKRSNQALKEFANVASHDLQEPLRKIVHFTEKIMQLSKNVVDDQCKDYLNRIQTSTERMNLFIDDLLSYSRVNTEAKPFKPVNLNEIIKLVLSGLEISIQSKLARVTIDELPVIEADSLQLYQLLLNLIANSLKFNKAQPPVIDITCQKGSDNFWEIRVKDNGIGINNEHNEKIFEPFFRAHGKSKYPGTGIGLAICKTLVERHGGTISADGEPGKGTTFFIRLPEKQLHGENL